MNLQPRRPPGRADEPFRHLIDEYRHREQTVICTCGWSGSSASPDGRTSDWKDHLTAAKSALASTQPKASQPKVSQPSAPRPRIPQPTAAQAKAGS